MANLSDSPKHETPIRLEQRKSYSLGLLFQNVQEVAYDLTGCTVTFVMTNQPYKGGVVKVNKDFVLNDPTHGMCRLDLQASELDLPADTYLYTIRLLTAQGYSVVIAKGELELLLNQESASVSSTYGTVNPPGSLTVTLQDQQVLKVVLNNLTPPRIDIGTVTTGAAGSSAAATITGNYPQEYLNLTIPRGDKGDKGDTGAQGIQGIQGPPGATPTGPILYDTDQTALTTSQRRQAQKNVLGTILWVTPEMYGAVGDGATDDTAAFVAALAASNHVRMSAKTYAIAGLVTVQAGQVLEGLGGSNQGVNPGASHIKMTNAAGQIWQRGAGSTLRNFSIDGNFTSANPLVTGGTNAGDAGTAPMLENVSIMQAASGGIAWKISAAQNGVATGVNLLNNGGTGLKIQDHGGGWLFDRLEITGSTTRNLHILDSGNLVFVASIIERAMDGALSPTYIEGSVWWPTIQFLHCTFSSGGVAVSGASRNLVEMIATGTVEFNSCQFAGITNEYAIRGGNGATAPVIHITGSTYFTGAGLLAFLDYDSTTVVDLDGEVRGQVAGIGSGTVPLRTGTSPVNNIGRFRQSSNNVYRTAATERADGSLVNGDTVLRYERLIDGTQKWGPGNGAADLVLARNGAASGFLTGSLQVSADMKATRFLHNRQDVVLSSNSAPAIDLSLGSCIFLKLNGFNLTGLSFTNAQIGQEIVMLVKQGATPSTVSLPLIAQGFYWDEGDANVPVVVAAASAWMALRFQVTDNGIYKEISRNGWVKNTIFMSNGTKIISGSGSPEGVVTAPVGSLYLRTDGSGGTLRYFKNTGTGNTGWIDSYNKIDVTFGAPAGNATVGSIPGRWYAPRAFTIASVRLSANTAPTGATLIADVNKNGTTIFTTQANRPAIAVSTNTVQVTNMDITAVAAGDYLQFDIDQIGSTVPGADVTLQISGYY